jgi:hypothetical protein
MTWSSDAESGEPPRLLLGAIVLAASLTLGLTLFFGVVLLPAVAVLAAAVSELVLFGALLLASSLIRIAAGLFAARMYRRRRGTDTRIEALPSVLTGVVIAWAVYFLLVATSASATGTDPVWVGYCWSCPAGWSKGRSVPHSLRQVSRSNSTHGCAALPRSTGDTDDCRSSSPQTGR